MKLQTPLKGFRKKRPTQTARGRTSKRYMRGILLADFDDFEVSVGICHCHWHLHSVTLTVLRGVGMRAAHRLLPQMAYDL
jgi:hypothetical protein